MKNGFSLIELLVVVVILSILSAVAFPAYHRYKKIAQKKELIKKAHNFWAAGKVCLMDSEVSGCNTLLTLGFHCPSGCQGPLDVSNTLSIMIEISGKKACVSLKKDGTRDVLMEGICHTSGTGGKAVFPLKICDSDGDCGTGQVCYAKKFTLDSTTKLCKEVI